MTKKIGRNDLCPCGSGKKYKRCCINKKTLPSNYTQLSNCINDQPTCAEVSAAKSHLHPETFKSLDDLLNFLAAKGYRPTIYNEFTVDSDPDDPTNTVRKAYEIELHCKHNLVIGTWDYDEHIDGSIEEAMSSSSGCDRDCPICNPI